MSGLYKGAWYEKIEGVKIGIWASTQRSICSNGKIQKNKS